MAQKIGTSIEVKIQRQMQRGVRIATDERGTELILIDPARLRSGLEAAIAVLDYWRHKRTS